MNRQYRRMLAKSGKGDQFAQEMYKIGANDANLQTTSGRDNSTAVRRESPGRNVEAFLCNKLYKKVAESYCKVTD